MHRPSRPPLPFAGLVLATVLAIFLEPVGACRCVGTPVCWAIDGPPGWASADVVFVGTVLESEFPATRFRVDRLVVGSATATVTLQSSVSGCSMSFTAGDAYLVYAYRDPATGTLSTSACSRTRAMSDPRASADLAYFDTFEAGRSDGWLSGIVEERQHDPTRASEWIAKPLAGIPITASLEGETRRTVTGATGLYVFTGLKPGSWRVVADLPDAFVPHDGTVEMQHFASQLNVVWLRDARCAEADIGARVDGSITGMIRDERGLPGRGIVVQLGDSGALQADPYAGAIQEAVADELGRFEFRPVPAGRYVVGVDIRGSNPAGRLDRRRYYPGVSALGTAAVIELDRAAHVQLEEFRLPRLPSERTIMILLRAPSAEIAAATTIYLTGATKQALDMTSGSVALQLPYGARYELTAAVPRGYRYELDRPGVSPRGYSRIGRDDTDQTIEILVRPQ